jgi:pilus assembly protein CpaE
MSHTVRTIVAFDSGIERARVEAVLSSCEGIHVHTVVDSLEDGWMTPPEGDAELLVVACSDSDMATRFIREAVEALPERPVVVLYQGSPNGFMRRAFEAGADDIVPLPQNVDPMFDDSGEQVMFALEKVLERKRGMSTTGTSDGGEMICVLGPKGGTGKTLTTANLSVSLVAQGKSVVIVDLDLQFGDVGLAFGIRPDKTIYDLARSSGAMDAEKVNDYLAVHDTGVRVLLAPIRPDQAGVVTVEFLRDIYQVLRSTFDYVILDTPPGFTPEVIGAIDAASHLLVVGMLDALSLKNTKLGLETLSMMGHSGEQIRVLLNRADSHVGLNQEDVASIVGRKPDVMVPSNGSIARSVNQGMPISVADPKCEAAKAFRSLATIYTGGSTNGDGGQAGRGLFGRRKG